MSKDAEPEAFTITLQIPAERLHDLIYGHSTYGWLHNASGEWRGPGIDCEYDAETDDEGAGTGRRILLEADILKGLAVMAEKVPNLFGQFMDDEADIIVTDAFYQCCIFGDLIYG